jgi:AAA+ ATPase superfamily predicted ATPase
MNFIGRKHELDQLMRLASLRKPSLVVCYGRRRIGKSTLIREFGKGFRNFIEVQGLAPNAGMNNADQLQHFMSEFSSQAGYPNHPIENWRQGFQLLSKHIGKKKCVVFLDEISWMGAFDPTFTAILKVAWDTEFKSNTGLILVLCGSVSSWISDNLLNSKDFMGRISLEIPVREMPLSDCNQFFGNKKNTISSREKLRFLSVTGGIPRYLEEINLSQNLDKNIRDLCFMNTGILFSEFDKIFNDIFQKRALSYRDLVVTLTNGALTLSELCHKLNTTPGGKITEYLRDLIVAGFLSSDDEWNLKRPSSKAKMIKYRISDNYLRFYLKYIQPSQDKISKNLFKLFSFSDLPGSEAMVGLQFESLILNNMESILFHLHLSGKDILKFGPYYQRQTLRTQACQIDLLIQTKYEIYVCELKTSSLISPSILQEVQAKVEKLSTPKRVSIRKALIHCSQVDPKVHDSDYFDKIISFEELLGT